MTTADRICLWISGAVLLALALALSGCGGGGGGSAMVKMPMQEEEAPGETDDGQAMTDDDMTVTDTMDPLDLGSWARTPGILGLENEAMEMRVTNGPLAGDIRISVDNPAPPTVSGTWTGEWRARNRGRSGGGSGRVDIIVRFSGGPQVSGVIHDMPGLSSASEQRANPRWVRVDAAGRFNDVLEVTQPGGVVVRQTTTGQFGGPEARGVVGGIENPYIDAVFGAIRDAE